MYMFTQYGVPVYTQSVNPLYQGMATFGYQQPIPLVNGTTAKIINGAYKNSLTPIKMGQGLFSNVVNPYMTSTVGNPYMASAMAGLNPYVNSPVPLLNKFYAQTVFPTTKKLSSNGLDINLFNPFDLSASTIGMGNGLFMRTCASPNCKRVSFFGSTFCCKECHLSLGANHSEKCNIRHSKSDGATTVSDNVIKFHNKGEPYFEFTNSYSVPVTIGTTTYKSTEHYFQSRKFTAHQGIVDLILSANTPEQAVQIAENNKALVDATWNTIRDRTMYDAIKAKFTQHPDLKEMLKNTRSAKLIFNNSTDEYWGVGATGTGYNQLGRLLTKLRNDLTSMTGGGMSDMDAKQKYIEYKNKYLALKKQFNL